MHPAVLAAEVIETVESDGRAEKIRLRDDRRGAVSAIRLSHDRHAFDVAVSKVGGSIDLRQDGVRHLLNGIAALSFRPQGHVAEQNRVTAGSEDLNGNRIGRAATNPTTRGATWTSINDNSGRRAPSQVATDDDSAQ